MKNLMIVAAVMAVAALMTTGSSTCGKTDGTCNNLTAATSCTNDFTADLLLACPGDGTNKLNSVIADCGKSCTNKFNLSLAAGTLNCTNGFTAAPLIACPGSCTNKVSAYLAECGKNCTNQFSVNLAWGTLNCTNEVSSVKI